MLEIDGFTQDELVKAAQLSPAISHYLRLIPLPCSNFSETLRRKRHAAWVKSALNTLYAKAATAEICNFWSATADELLKEAWKEAELEKEPIALFALGKLGSHELNLSSDIDIIVVSSKEADEALFSKVRNFRRLLSENSMRGFVFRVDFDLRPGGKSSSLVTRIDHFENHYWSQGEPWERLALTRLRFICGSTSLGDEVETLARKYSYRKFIDIGLLEDLKNLRQRIHQNLLSQGIRIENHVKLGIGGIRDIELFLQSLVVIHGGRAPQLQKRQTTEIAETLHLLKILPKAEADFLVHAYWCFRDIEHRLQLVRDHQTHSFPERPLPEEILSSHLKSEFKTLSEEVDQIVSSLLGKVDLSQPHLSRTLEGQRAWLASLGFSEVSTQEIWPSLIENTALVQRNRHAETARQEFLYRFVNALVEAQQDRDMGLSFLLDFIRATRAKSSFYSLLIREDELLKDLAHLFSTSPYLSQVLCSRPELIDSLLLRSEEPYSQDFDQMLEDMTESKFISELLCALEFLRGHNLFSLSENLTLTADRITRHLLQELKQQYAPNSMLNILCLGKWGGQELGFRSDLDFVFLTPDTPDEGDYKVAKRFTSRLQDPHRGGKLYGIDLRLRPSGNAGPLILSRNHLQDFLKTKAEAWQRQSYLRARFLHEEDWKVQDFIRQGLDQNELQQLKDIRTKLTHPLDKSPLNIKLSEGGLIDCELCIQTLILFHKIPTAARTELQVEDLVSAPVSQEALQSLKQNYFRLRTVEQMMKLLQQSDSLTPPTNPHHQDKLAKILQVESEGLEGHLLQILRDNHTKIKELDPVWA